MKLTFRPSGEILGSASAALPETSVRPICDFTSSHASAVGPSNRMLAPSGTHWFFAGARRARTVACEGLDVSAGKMDSSFAAVTRRQRETDPRHNAGRRGGGGLITAYLQPVDIGTDVVG